MGRTARRDILKLTAIGLAAPFLVRAAHATPTPPYRITATTSQIADLVRRIAGDRARVEALLGEGVDPHTYKLTRSDVVRLTGADVVFFNGLQLEGKMTDMLYRLAEAGRPVHRVAEMVDPGRLISPPEFEGHADPHVWMDPGLWRTVTGSTAAALAAFDPDGADLYRRNAEAYSAELDALDAYARRALGSIPAAARALVTAHDAFNYLGRAYGMDVRGIQGISTESEAGLREIEDLVSLLADRRIPAVFAESSVPDRNVRALIEGAAARGHHVALGGNLYSDAMGPPGTYEGTYVGMIDHNVTTIARALGGEAPERGLSGHLTALVQ